MMVELPYRGGTLSKDLGWGSGFFSSKADVNDRAYYLETLMVLLSTLIKDIQRI